MMTTSINSEKAHWTPEIQEAWDACAAARPEGVVVSANYFTPRPYVDEYNRGSSTRGFCYTVAVGDHNEVYMLTL